MKDNRFSAERELRVSLSTIGMGRFVLNDQSDLVFTRSLRMDFNFRAAINDGTICRIEAHANCDSDFLNAELQKLRIIAKSAF